MNEEANMEIWDSLCVTDPKMTKEVKYGGRKFHSIDSHWQIEKMTRLFGPCGKGWGYSAKYGTITIACGTMVTAEISIWYLMDDGSKNTYGPVASSCELELPRMDRDKKPIYDDAGNITYRVDTDAHKKAMTDALTKSLSHIGMSADVFRGKHDNSKYVDYMSEIHSGSQQATMRLLTAIASASVNDIRRHADRARTLHANAIISDEQRAQILKECKSRYAEMDQKEKPESMSQT